MGGSFRKSCEPSIIVASSNRLIAGTRSLPRIAFADELKIKLLVGIRTAVPGPILLHSDPHQFQELFGLLVIHVERDWIVASSACDVYA